MHRPLLVSFRRRGRTARPLALVLTAMAVTLAACSSTSSSSSSAASSTSSVSASYFRGKTITLIAPDKPGGGYDSYARLFAPYLAKELGATVNVENIAGAGTLDGTNQLAASTPNGLTIGMVNVGGDITSKVEGLPGENFSMTSFGWIGQPAVVPNVMLTQPGSSVKSFATLLHASSPVTVLDIQTGVGNLLNHVVFGAFKIPNHLVTGFSNVAALKQGFLANDGQIIFESLPSMYSLIAGNQAKPLLYTGTLTFSSYRHALAGVPSLQSELSKASLSASQKAAVTEALTLSNTAFDFAAPPGVPAKVLAVLRQAFTAAANLPALKAQAQKEALALSPISGSELGPEVDAAVTHAKAIAPYVSSSNG